MTLTRTDAALIRAIFRWQLALTQGLRDRRLCAELVASAAHKVARQRGRQKKPSLTLRCKRNKK